MGGTKDPTSSVFIVVRYVDKDLKVQERLLSMQTTDKCDAQWSRRNGSNHRSPAHSKCLLLHRGSMVRCGISETVGWQWGCRWWRACSSKTTAAGHQDCSGLRGEWTPWAARNRHSTGVQAAAFLASSTLFWVKWLRVSSHPAGIWEWPQSEIQRWMEGDAVKEVPLIRREGGATLLKVRAGYFIICIVATVCVCYQCGYWSHAVGHHMLDQRRLICGVCFYVALGYLACFLLLIG